MTSERTNKIGHYARVAVVVLNWNGLKDTPECVESITRIPYPNLKIIVVDNGSSDGSCEAIRARFPQVTIIETGANLGFAGGNNVGIKRALDEGTDYVLVLNNDTYVDPEIVSSFIHAAEAHPDGGVFGAKIFFSSEPDRIWYAGGAWDPVRMTFFQPGYGTLDHGQYTETSETGWVIGCAMFIRAEVFARIGLLEGKYFLNMEEIDFCCRAKRAGFGNYFVPQAKLWHKVSASYGGEDSPMKIYFDARNRLLWAERNARLAQRIAIYRASLWGLVTRFISPFFREGLRGFRLKESYWTFVQIARDPFHKAYLFGVRDYWLRRFGNCPDRVRALSQEWAQARMRGDA